MTQREHPLVTAVRADLRRWKIPVSSALGASALDLAARLSVEDIRPAAAAMLHAQFRATLLELGKVAAPEAKPDDAVDQVRAQREKRLKGA